jgi:hypothetical protein
LLKKRLLVSELFGDVEGKTADERVVYSLVLIFLNLMRNGMMINKKHDTSA